MHTIIDALPIRGPSQVTLDGGYQVQLLERQIILWISVTPTTVIELPQNARRFPAVLDTGFNFTFAIAVEQLRAWSGVDVRQLRRFPEDQAGLPTIKGQKVPALEATIWLFSNVPGQRDNLLDRPPFWTYPHPGIFVLPPDLSPRLPLIGMKFLEQNGLQVSLDPEQTSPNADDFEIKAFVRSVIPPQPLLMASQ